MNFEYSGNVHFPTKSVKHGMLIES